MNLQSAFDGFRGFIDCVASAVILWISWLRPPLQVRLVEEDNDSFRIELPTGRERAGLDKTRVRLVHGTADVPSAIAEVLQGSEAEIVLRSQRFLFRPLEVPRRAAEFLDGIVRAQIDRLTPWNAHDAAFGWMTSTAAAKDRIALSVCATARSLLTPYVDVLLGLGVESVAISTLPEMSVAGTSPIRVLERRGSSVIDQDRIRRYLSIALLVSGLFAVLSTIANEFLGGALDAQQLELSQEISQRRAMIRSNGAPAASSALQMLSQRKHESPSSVLVLEALSKILPDHTYVTELRVEGEKIQLVGLTRDAPALIPLIENSPSFTRATFFAPTTSTEGEPGEHFHIEAQVKPVFATGP